jgi:AbrB family looped-hinge helix DNA binding protein
MSTRVKVSSRFQIAVPSKARKELGIERGDEFIVDVRDGYMVLIPAPRDYVARLRGLHRDIWAEVDPNEYLEQERSAWPT